MSTMNCRILLLAVLFLNAVAATAEQTQVVGRVVDRIAGGAGLPGAKIAVFLKRLGDPNPIPVCESPDRTEDDGRFSFACELQGDPVELHVSRPAYIPDPYRVTRLRMTQGETTVPGVPPFDGIPLSPVRDARAFFEQAARQAATAVLDEISTLEEQAAAVRAMGLRPEEEAMFLAALTTAVEDGTRAQEDQYASVDQDADAEGWGDDALPSTASALALIGSLGLGSLAAAFVLRRRNRHSRR